MMEALENETSASLNAGAIIKTIMLESAARCKIKRRKQPKEGDQKTTPWFDGACESAKNEVKKLGNDLKKDPENQELRNAIGRKKRA